MIKAKEFERALDATSDSYWDVTFAIPVGKRSASLAMLRYVQYDDGDNGIVGRYYDPATNEDMSYLPLPGDIIAFRRVSDDVALADWRANITIN